MSDPIKPDLRKVRADARDVRQDARDVRADAIDKTLQDRDVRVSVKEDVVTVREGDVIEHESTVTHSLRFIKWLTVVLVILTLGGTIRTFVLQDATEKTTQAAQTAEEAAHQARTVSVEARDASLDTLTELRAIVSSLEATEAANEGQPELLNQAIIDALAAVARIEGKLCGGPCPEVNQP